MPLPETILPAVALALFAAGVLVGAKGFFTARAADAFLPQAEPAPGKDWKCSRRRVFWLVLAGGFLVQAALLALTCQAHPGMTAAQAAQQLFGGGIDARHYLNLARWGYGTGAGFPDQQYMIVFFPLFPALLRLFNPLGQLNWWLLGLAVQPPMLALAAALLWTLMARHGARGAAGWAVAFLLVQPAGFFFLAPMTESLFLLLCLTFVLLLEQDRWLWCGVVGMLAALCRSPGVLLAGLAMVYLAGLWLRGKKIPRPGWLAPILGPFAGLGIYFGLNQLVYGRWDQYAVYQWEHWNQRLGFFPDTVAYLLEYVQTWWQDHRDMAVWISLVGAVCILAQLTLLLAAARRLPVHWLAFGLAYTAVTTGVTWLLSAPRYAAGLFCLPAALALLCRKRWQRMGVLALLALAALAYGGTFFAGGPIY